VAVGFTASRHVRILISYSANLGQVSQPRVVVSLKVKVLAVLKKVIG